MTVRLTKRRLEALHVALSLDDVLYEKFRREHLKLHREIEQTYRRLRNIRVLGLKDGVYHAMNVLDVHISPDGSTVVVHLPSEASR